MKFSLLTIIIIFAFHPLSTFSFVPVGFQKISSTKKSLFFQSSSSSFCFFLSSSKQHPANEFDNLQRTLGAFAFALSLVVLNPSISASAGAYPMSPSSNYISSSAGSSSTSIQIAEAIKILDMSLPSYGEIAPPKASVDAIKGIQPDKEPASTTSVLSAKKSAGSAKKKANSEKKAKVIISDSVETTAYSDKQEIKELDSIKFMDMSMPSYSESATVTKKNMFAL
jgi:hypothetical protein